MNELSVRIINQEVVKACGGADLDAAIVDVENVFRLMAAGETVLPTKVILRWGDSSTEFTRGRFNAMPAFVGGEYNMAGIKWIGSFPSNVERGMPRASGIVVLSDPDTGWPLAFMEGTIISAARTAAATAVAARHLATSGKLRIGLVGAGVINRMHLPALLAGGIDVASARVYDIVRSRAEQFAEDVGGSTGIAVKAADSLQGALEDMDIVIVAITSGTPIIGADWLKPGVLFAEIGGRGAREDALRSFDKFVVDSWTEVRHRYAGQLTEQGSFIQLIESGQLAITAEMSDVVTGVTRVRASDEEKIFVNCVGMGTEDVAVATRVYRTAVERGMGTVQSWWDTPFAV